MDHSLPRNRVTLTRLLQVVTIAHLVFLATALDAADPPFVIGFTSRYDITKALGKPLEEIHFADGVVRARWPRTRFNGVNLTGTRVSIPTTFYDCDFGPETILLDWRPVDGSVPLASGPNHGNEVFPTGLDREAADRILSIAIDEYPGVVEGLSSQLASRPDLAKSRDDENGDTPLHRAADRGNVGIAKVLLKYGASIEARQFTGETPLISACQSGRVQVVQLLLTAGANVNAGNVSQMTALHLIGGNLVGGTDPPDATANDAKIAELLLMNHADIEARDRFGMTPLQRAAWNGRIGVVQVLLMHGAEINVKDNKGRTPLVLAKAEKHKDVVALLSQHGAR
jgi:hypothetical protein